MDAGGEEGNATEEFGDIEMPQLDGPVNNLPADDVEEGEEPSATVDDLEQSTEAPEVDQEGVTETEENNPDDLGDDSGEAQTAEEEEAQEDEEMQGDETEEPENPVAVQDGSEDAENKDPNETEANPDGLENEEIEEEEEDEEELISETNNNIKETSDPDEGQSAPDAVVKRKRSASNSSNDEGPMRKQTRSGSTSSQRHDTYCWVCHRDGVQVFCKICPRSYHFKCIHEDPSKAESTTKSCICPECAIVMNAENLETRSDAMKQLTMDQLITMLKNACERMKNLPGAEPFLYPVDPSEAVDYFTYVVYPMDLYTLEKNVKQREYGSTEAFLADAQWLVHNSIVFNSASSPFTTSAKRILKTCKQEIQEIETCPECYVNAHNKPDCWFIEACKRPHVLVWAKLKGFPFWPAKAMKIKDDNVDVRFFGQHDRAWVLRKDCFLYSEEMPGSGAPPKRNNQLLAAMEELNSHIEKLKEINGPFVFAPPKTPIGPQLSVEQIRIMLPEFKPEEKSPQQKMATLDQQQIQAKVKSPMTIRISSLKTCPTIVKNNSAELTPSKPILRIRKATVNIEKLNTLSVETQQQAETKDEHETEENEEDNERITEKSASTTLAKSTGFLASALSNRMTRRNSRSDTASPTSASADERIGEKRLTRSANKTSISNESADESTKDESIPQPPETFLQSIGLRKTSDVKVTVQHAQASKHSGRSDVIIKGEPQDMEEELSDGADECSTSRPSAVGVKAHELMNQISGGSGKSGMRFNLSKDISISPVEESKESSGSRMEMRQQKKPILQGHNSSSRMLPGLIPQNLQLMSSRPPRQMQNSNGVMNNQRMTGHPPRQMMRPQQQRPGGNVRPGGVKINRPQNMQMASMHMKNQQGQKMKDPNSMVVESSSLRMDGGQSSYTLSGGAVQMNQVQSLQGAITLPGGTITVTPLAPIIGLPITTSAYTGDNMNGSQTVSLKHNIAATSVTSANGLPISVISPHDNNQSLLKSNKPAVHQRRNLMNQIPPSVGHLVQTLQKTLAETVKTAMEQIVVEMIDVNVSGGTEAKTLKEENEKLRKQLIDHRHQHESTVREVKLAMDSDRKRALSELRRQCEQEKAKAIEETKKKQWCARCGREAQFYCCWNTSYCGYNCQEDHWPSHMNSCSQSNAGGARQ